MSDKSSPTEAQTRVWRAVQRMPFSASIESKMLGTRSKPQDVDLELVADFLNKLHVEIGKYVETSEKNNRDLSDLRRQRAAIGAFMSDALADASVGAK